MRTKYLLLLIFMSFLFSLHSQCFNESNAYTFNYNGHTYKIIKENKNWIDAVNCATSTGGYLAEINDVQEHNALFSEVANANIDVTYTLNEFGTAAIWLGGTDQQQEGNWIWDGNNDGVGEQFWMGNENGHTVNGAYTNWGIYPPEPDNSGGDQNYLTLTIDDFHDNYGRWNDLSNDYSTLYYVIEYDQILSVQNNQLKNQVHIFPNPFNKEINIENNTNLDILNISITNLLGQEVLSSSSFINKKINTENLENGIYFLHLHFLSNKTLHFKLIKNNL